MTLFYPCETLTAMNAIPSKFCWGDGVDQPQHLVAKSEFPSDASREDGLSVYCRKCGAARQRAWKRANPEKVKAWKRKYRESKRAGA